MRSGRTTSRRWARSWAASSTGSPTSARRWLHLKWRVLVALFGVSKSRVDVLNASASGFFGLLETSLWNDLLLHLCTLTDDPQVGRKQTLTVLRLPTLVDPKIHEKIRGLVSAVVKKTKFARDWRNRHIAHRDLSLALKRGAKPLAPASRKRVKEAMGRSSRSSARSRSTT